MSTKKYNLLQAARNPKTEWLVFGGLLAFYLVRALYIATTTWVGMDEGYYLIKGYWFLTGQQVPFSVNGAITNKPPFAFFIPGLSQFIAPGIFSGRIFAILTTILSLIGLWLIIRRNSNAWWANLALISFAANQFWVETYTREYTQTLTFFFLIWSFYFGLGKQRSNRQIIIGGIMAIMTVMIRQNMAPYYALFALYLAWEHSIKKAFLLLIPSGLLFVGVHIYYWPEIFLNLWVTALPRVWRPPLLNFLGLQDILRFKPEEGREIFDYSFWQIVHAYSRVIKTSFLAVFIAFIANFLLPSIWRVDRERAKQNLLVILTFDMLLAVHLNVVVNQQVLLFNLPVYLLFWAPTIFILLPDAYHVVGKHGRNWAARSFLPVGMILFFGLLALGYYSKLSSALMNLAVPRIGEGTIQPGSTELWRVLVNKFGLDPKIQAYLLPALFGLAGGTVIVVFLYLLSKLFQRTHGVPSRRGMFAALLAGFLFISSLPSIPRENIDRTCQVNTITALRVAGEAIGAQIEPNALLFWAVENQPSIGALFHFGPVRIFPKQLNGEHYYRKYITLEESKQSRYWSDAQAKEWLKQADYLIGEPGRMEHWLELVRQIPGLEAVKLDGAPPMNPCSENSRILLYKLQPE